MEELFGTILGDPVVQLVMKFFGVAGLTWLLTESLPEAFVSLQRFDKKKSGLVIGPTLSLFFYAIGAVQIDFALPGFLAQLPDAFEAVIRVVSVGLLGGIATLCARGFHNLKVGSKSDPAAGA